jgi:hypothetical protein
MDKEAGTQGSGVYFMVKFICLAFAACNLVHEGELCSGGLYPRLWGGYKTPPTIMSVMMEGQDPSASRQNMDRRQFCSGGACPRLSGGDVTRRYKKYS